MKTSLVVCALAVLATVVALAAMGVLKQGTPPPDDGQVTAPRPGVGPDGLLPVDESMLEMAAISGGDFYFWSPGEFARSELRIPVVGEAVLLTYGDLGPGGRSFSFPVDGLTGRLDVFVGAQRLDAVRLVRPDSRVVEGTDPDVDLQVFDRMHIASIGLPASGAWRLELEGRGKMSVSVHSSVGNGLPYGDRSLEPIQLLDFEFVERRGRPGHQGDFALKRPAVPGATHRIELELCGSFESLEVLMADAGAAILGEVSIDGLDTSGDGKWVTAVGSCVVPDGPFRVVVQGFDATGARYQRMLSSSILPAAGE